MKNGNVLCNLFLASAAGLALGLLFAPQKGSQTRKEIKQKAEDMLEDEIIGYNRMICDVKIKLDQILNGLSIPVDQNMRYWADVDQKNEIIV